MNGRGDSKRESIQIKFVYSGYANVRKSVKRKDYILSKIYNVTFRKHLACVYLVCLSLSKLERKNLSQQQESLTCVSVSFKIFTKNTGVLSSNAHNN